VPGQVHGATQPSAFGISGGEQHPPHTGLHQGAGAHRAGFERHDQAAVVETPAATHGRSLAQRHQLGMTEWILIQLAAVAAPAEAAPFPIQHHRRHRDLSPVTGAAGLAQQPLHP